MQARLSAMRARTLFAVLLLLAATPALAQKVYVDYDSTVAFSQINTYQLVETKHDLRDTWPGLHKQVIAELRRYAAEGSLTEATSDPDVYLAYYTADRGELRLVMGDLEYAYGDGLTAAMEAALGTSDFSTDSDLDRLDDGEELELGTDPAGLRTRTTTA